MLSAHGRQRRPGAVQGPIARAGERHPDLLRQRQRRADQEHDLGQRAACTASRPRSGKAASACRSSCSGRAAFPPARSTTSRSSSSTSSPRCWPPSAWPSRRTAKLDGVNLLPYLTADKAGHAARGALLAVRRPAAVRKGDWKLTDLGEGPKLFNLSQDIGEKDDLAAKYPAKLAELEADYQAWNAGNIEARWKPAPPRRANATAFPFRREESAPRAVRRVKSVPSDRS